jgi:hypothetical protein
MLIDKLANCVSASSVAGCSKKANGTFVAIETEANKSASFVFNSALVIEISEKNSACSFSICFVAEVVLSVL